MLNWRAATLADTPALRIVGAGATVLTFRQLSERSNRVANGLRDIGVQRGDRVLVMLGNVAPLWEVMLAAMKLGAVVVPATTLLTAADLAERVARARVRCVVTMAADAEKLGYSTSPTSRPITSRTPDSCTAYAITTALDTTRPWSRTLTCLASTHR